MSGFNDHKQQDYWILVYLNNVYILPCSICFILYFKMFDTPKLSFKLNTDSLIDCLYMNFIYIITKANLLWIKCCDIPVIKIRLDTVPYLFNSEFFHTFKYNRIVTFLFSEL